MASYVETVIPLNHTMNASATVLAGPGSAIYAAIGSISSGERVQCIKKEGDYFLIEYIVQDDGVEKRKRGYVVKNNVTEYAYIDTIVPEQELCGYLDFAFFAL